MRELIPHTMEELHKALGEMTPNSKILGGGTDFVIQLQMGKFQPDALLYVGEVEEMRRIERTDDALIVGAAVTMRQLAQSDLVTEEFFALTDAAGDVGSPQIRNKGTLGGNLMNASPAGDTPPTLFLLDAQVEIAGPQGLRTIPVSELLLGPGKTSVAYNEAVVRFIFKRRPGWRSHFVKLGFRGKVTISRIGLTMLLRQDESGAIQEAKVFVGAISLTPVRLEEAEKLMIGRKPGSELAKDVGQALAALILKITPEKFDRDYKISASRGVAEDVLALF